MPRGKPLPPAIERMLLSGLLLQRESGRGWRCRLPIAPDLGGGARLLELRCAPDIFAVDGFLAPRACEELIAAAAGRLRPSPTGPGLMIFRRPNCSSAHSPFALHRFAAAAPPPRRSPARAFAAAPPPQD